MYSERPLTPRFYCPVVGFILCLVLFCSSSVCLFCPFSILITLLGEEGAGLCAYRAFVSYAHVNLCHFSSSAWCRGLAAASACGCSWTFLFIFLRLTRLDTYYNCIKNDNTSLEFLCYCTFLETYQVLSFYTSWYGCDLCIILID